MHSVILVKLSTLTNKMFRNRDSNNIKYNVMEQDVEVLIPPHNVTGKSTLLERNASVFRLCVKFVVVIIFVLIFCTIIVSGYFYMFGDKFHYITGNSCTPLLPVINVTVRLVEAQNYSCHDHTTCGSLLRRIEQEQDGLRYNFVIGSDMELYIGLGFKCRANRHLDELHIKLITPDLLSNSTLAEVAFRVFHIIDEGLKCGNILQNYSVTYTCDGDEPGCPSAVQYMDGIGDLDKMVHQSFDSMAHHTIHSPTSETGIILHKAFRWTACGKASHEAKNVTRSKVVTLESLPRQSCQPYKPVDQIDIDIVEVPNSLNCSDSTCGNLIPYIESQHDGFKYNFVINGNGHLYVGLGFRCQANQTETNKLKIKVLVKYVSSLIMFKISEIIKEGLLCHKITKHYSVHPRWINSNRNDDTFKKYLKNIGNQNSFVFLPSRSDKARYINDHIDSHIKLLPDTYRMLACARLTIPSDLESTTRLPPETTTDDTESSTNVPTVDTTVTPTVDTADNLATTPRDRDDYGDESVMSVYDYLEY